MRAFAVGLVASAVHAAGLGKGTPGDFAGDYIFDGHSNPHIVSHHRDTYAGYLRHRNYGNGRYAPRVNDPYPGDSDTSETEDDRRHIHTDSESYHDSFSDEGTSVNETDSIISHDSFDNYAQSNESYHDSDFHARNFESDGIFSSLGSSDSGDYDHTDEASSLSLSSLGSEIDVYDYLGQHSGDDYTDGSSSIDSFSESNFGTGQQFEEYNPYFDYGYALDYDWYDNEIGRVDDYTYTGPTSGVIVDRYKSRIPVAKSYHE